MGASLLSSLTGFPAPTVTASVREENARSTHMVSVDFFELAVPQSPAGEPLEALVEQ